MSVSPAKPARTDNLRHGIKLVAITGEQLDDAMKKLNKGVRLLYWLWVEPYLAIWNCGGGMKAHFRKLLSGGIAAAEQEAQN